MELEREDARRVGMTTIDAVRDAHKRWQLRVPSLTLPYRVMLDGKCVGAYKDMGDASDYLNTLSKGAQLFKYVSIGPVYKMVALSRYAHSGKDRDAWLGNVDTEATGSPDFEYAELSVDED